MAAQIAAGRLGHAVQIKASEALRCPYEWLIHEGAEHRIIDANSDGYEVTFDLLGPYGMTSLTVAKRDRVSVARVEREASRLREDSMNYEWKRP